MISKALFIVCSLILIPMNYAEIIHATKTDANTVYYIANSSNAFETGYILCDQAKPICHVECNAEYSCHQSTINATSSQQLNLECNDKHSCEAITVYGPTNSVNTQCNEYHSCSDAIFQFSDTISVHMNCGGITGDNNTYSCSLMNMDVSRSESVDVECKTRYACENSTIDGSFVSDTVNVNCEASNSCYNLFILCPNGDNSCHLNCKDSGMSGSGSGSTEGSCNKAWIKLDWQSLSERQQNIIDSPILNLSCSFNTSDCAGIVFDCDHYDSKIGGAEKTEYEWNSATQTYKCSNLICCPIYAGNIILCEADKDCHIECVDDDECANYIINATDSTSLTADVDCSGCGGNYFLCPASSSASCNINCTSCFRSVIYGNGATDINIQCTSSYSCYYLQMFITSENNLVNLLCNDGACWYAEFTNYGKKSISNIECRFCMGSVFRFNSSNAISITCADESACTLARFHGGYGGDVSVECSALKACYYASLYALDVDSLTVRANANDTFGTGMYVFNPPVKIANGTQIICEFERACSNLDMDYGYSDSVYGWLDIQCNDPTNVCSDIIVECGVVLNTGIRERTETILSSNASIGEYICNPTSESMLCCPFSKTPSTSINPSASPTFHPTDIQNTEATELVSTILSSKGSGDYGENDVYTLSVTIPALFVILLQIMF